MLMTCHKGRVSQDIMLLVMGMGRNNRVFLIVKTLINNSFLKTTAL